MRHWFSLLLLGVLPLAVSAEEIQLKAVITGPSDISVGRTIVLDASASQGLGEKADYRWYVEDSRLPISRTVEAVYTPMSPGELTFRLVIHSKIGEEEYEAEARQTVTVYERKVVLVADPTLSKRKLELHKKMAGEAGVFLRVLQPEESAVPLGAEEAIFSVLAEKGGALSNAETIVLWTEGIAGLQALMRSVQREPERMAGLQNQMIVLLSNRSLNTLARTARGPFTVIRPKQIILTREEAAIPLFSARNIREFLDLIQQRDIDYLVIDESTVRIRPWNILSTLVNTMMIQGVSGQTVILLLMLPIIATILAFFKQVVGITTFGLYTPSIVALSFLALGWWIGVIFLLLIVATGYITRAFMRTWRLLYIPKVAIILTVVSVTLLALLAVGASFGFTFSRDTVFILLIMSTLSESFLTLKTEEGFLSAVLAIGETIVAAVLCVFIVQWPWLQALILAYPELLLLTIAINLGLGRYSGLRLIEYFNFREVFRYLQEE